MAQNLTETKLQQLYFKTPYPNGQTLLQMPNLTSLLSTFQEQSTENILLTTQNLCAAVIQQQSYITDALDITQYTTSPISSPLPAYPSTIHERKLLFSIFT
jgi:hypothetical protein